MLKPPQYGAYLQPSPQEQMAVLCSRELLAEMDNMFAWAANTGRPVHVSPTYLAAACSAFRELDKVREAAGERRGELIRGERAQERVDPSTPITPADIPGPQS